MEPTKKAVLYCRVSTKEQAEEGNSLVTQEKICNEYALKNGYEVIETFIEHGESAKTTDRTQLQRLLTYCSAKRSGISAVITYKIDRVARNSGDYSQIKLMLRRFGVEIKSTTEYIEDTPAGRFMENIIANVAQFDNDVRTERCVGGMRDAMREGRYVWMATIGYINTKMGGKATIRPDEMASLIRTSFEQVAKGSYFVDEVWREMVTRGLRLKNGQAPSKAYFHKLLRNKLYCGYIEKFGESHKGTFEPIVSEELFNQVQRVLRRKGRTVLEYKTNHPDFPLRRFIAHPSGEKLTGGWSRGCRSKYPYYRFNHAKLNLSRAALEEEFVKYMNGFGMETQELKEIKQLIRDSYYIATKDKQGAMKKLQQKKTELLSKQNLLFEKNCKGLISDSFLKTQSEAIETELLKIDEQLNFSSSDLPDPLEAIEYAEEFLLKPGNVWAKSTFISKLKLQQFKFPQGIIFDGTKFRTTQVALWNKEIFPISGKKSSRVDFSIEPLNYFIQNCDTVIKLLKAS